jgi:hypothetical protein
MEDQRVESSAAVGSLKLSWRMIRIYWLTTSALCVATTSATIPLGNKVSGALLVNPTRCFEINPISWVTPHLVIMLASFVLTITYMNLLLL